MRRCTAARGIAFTALLFREAGRKDKGRKRGRDLIQMLLWLLFTQLLLSVPLSSSSHSALLSTKVCLIHKRLIAITAAATGVCSGYSISLVTLSRKGTFALRPFFVPCCIYLLPFVFQSFFAALFILICSPVTQISFKRLYNLSVDF